MSKKSVYQAKRKALVAEFFSHVWMPKDGGGRPPWQVGPWNEWDLGKIGRVVAWAARTGAEELFPTASSYRQMASVLLMAGSKCLRKHDRSAPGAFLLLLASALLQADADLEANVGARSIRWTPEAESTRAMLLGYLENARARFRSNREKSKMGFCSNASE